MSCVGKRPNTFLNWFLCVCVCAFVNVHVCLLLVAGTDFSLRDFGFGEAIPSHVAAYRADQQGLPHRDYLVSVGSDADTETDGIMSPEHAVRLWGRNTKSGRSSCLSSRANSNLTLTDTEHENTENGKTRSPCLLSLSASVSPGTLLADEFLH